MGWTREEFWQATPALLNSQMRQHIRTHSRKKKGQRKAAPVPVKYVDQLPGNFW